MKNIKNITLFITFLFLAAVSNGSIAINTIKTTEADDTPAPEIIACERQGTCEMTMLNMLMTNDE